MEFLIVLAVFGVLSGLCVYFFKKCDHDYEYLHFTNIKGTTQFEAHKRCRKCNKEVTVTF